MLLSFKINSFCEVPNSKTATKLFPVHTQFLHAYSGFHPLPPGHALVFGKTLAEKEVNISRGMEKNFTGKSVAVEFSVTRVLCDTKDNLKGD